MNTEEQSLYEALLTLKTPAECASFFHDLCTPTEIHSMSERWRVAQLLNERVLSYRAIHQQTGVSLSTISRVARFLSQETYQGYKLVLNRLQKLAH